MIIKLVLGLIVLGFIISVFRWLNKPLNIRGYNAPYKLDKKGKLEKQEEDESHSH